MGSLSFHSCETGAGGILIYKPEVRVTLLVQKTWEYTSKVIDTGLYLEGRCGHICIFGSSQLESLYVGTYCTRDLPSPSYSSKAIEGFSTCYGTLTLEANLKDMGHDCF